MTRIAIIRCDEKSRTCAGTGCFKAIREKEGAFAKYDDEIEIIGFDTCGGCSQGRPDKVLAKVESLVQKGAEVIHLSTCIKGGCPVYKMYLEEVSKCTRVDGDTC